MSPEDKARYVVDLQTGRPRCPFCGAGGDELFPAEQGLETIEDFGDHHGHVSHLIYCPVEDRNFEHIYAPSRPPKARARLKCKECGQRELEDVLPETFFDIAPDFTAQVKCATCGADVSEEKYTVVDVRDLGGS